MGGGKSGSTGTQSSNQTSTVSIPPEVLARYNSVNAQAQDVSQNPFQSYGGEFVAPINEQQQYGINQITGAGGWINPTYNNTVNTISAGLGSAAPQYDAASGNIGAGLAGGTAANQTALGQYSGALGAAQPYNTGAGNLYGGATGLALAGTGAVNPGAVDANSIGQYMSPYNSAVVQSTMALLGQQQAQQQNALKTQQILGGSFGGDRSGIDRAVLSGQQNLATGNIVSNLYNQNYGQALGAAQQQQGVGLGAAQANRAAIQQGAGQLTNLGQATQGLGQQVYGQGTGQAAFTGQIGQQGYQQALGAAGARQGLGQAEFGTSLAAAQGYGQAGQAALQGQLAQGQAALGAGTVQQQTQQAQDTAQYNQFLQQQAYPFQTTQFLANIAEGTGALSGSTTNAAANQYTPQPFFSDRRLKENIKRIGTSSAGIPIVRYNYKGSPHTQIGMIAQDVEKKRPDAVGLAAGYKTVDYDRATRARGGLAGGGPATVIYHIGGSVGPEDAGRGFADGGGPDPVAMARALAARHPPHQLMKADLMQLPETQSPDLPRTELKVPEPSNDEPSAPFQGGSSYDFGGDRARSEPGEPSHGSSQGTSDERPVGPIVGGNLVQRARHAIGQMESGNRYGVTGVVTNGDRPYGRYQVMGANVGPWTKAALGTSMTPDQFLRSPEAQDKVFDHVFGGYLAKHGPEDAASMWFSGRPLKQAKNDRDALGTTVPGYVKNFVSLMGKSEGFAAGGAPSAGLDPITMAQILAAQQAMYPGGAGRGGMGGEGPRGIQIAQSPGRQLMKADLMKLQEPQQQTTATGDALKGLGAAAGAGRDIQALYGLGKEAAVGSAAHGDVPATGGIFGYGGKGGAERPTSTPAPSTPPAAAPSSTSTTPSTPSPAAPTTPATTATNATQVSGPTAYVDPDQGTRMAAASADVPSALDAGSTAADSSMLADADLLSSAMDFAWRGRYAAGGMPYGDAGEGYIPADDYQPIDPGKLEKEQKGMEAPLMTLPKERSGSGGSGAGKTIGSLIGGIGGSFFGPVGSMAGSGIGGLVGSEFKRGGRTDNVIPFPGLGGARRGYEGGGGADDAATADAEREANERRLSALSGAAPRPSGADVVRPGGAAALPIGQPEPPPQPTLDPQGKPLTAATDTGQAPSRMIPAPQPAPGLGARSLNAQPVPGVGGANVSATQTQAAPTTTGQPDFGDRLVKGLGQAGDWVDRHQGIMVPALSFLGSMLSSPSRTLAGSIGSGLVGGANAWAGQQGINQGQQRVDQGNYNLLLNAKRQYMDQLIQYRQMKANLRPDDPMHATYQVMIDKAAQSMAQVDAQLGNASNMRLPGATGIEGTGPSASGVTGGGGGGGTGGGGGANVPAPSITSTTPLPQQPSQQQPPQQQPPQQQPPPSTSKEDPYDPKSWAPMHTPNTTGLDIDPYWTLEGANAAVRNASQGTPGQKEAAEAHLRDVQERMKSGYLPDKKGTLIKVNGVQEQAAELTNIVDNAKRVTEEAQQSTSYPDMMAQIQYLKQTLAQFPTGAGAKELAAIAAGGARVGLPLGDAASPQEFLKNSIGLILKNPALQGPGTDHLREMVASMSPDIHLQPRANRAIISELEASADVAQKRREDFANIYNGKNGGPSATHVPYARWLQQWNDAKAHPENDIKTRKDEIYKHTPARDDVPDSFTKEHEGHEFVLTLDQAISRLKGQGGITEESIRKDFGDKPYQTYLYKGRNATGQPVFDKVR